MNWAAPSILLIAERGDQAAAAVACSAAARSGRHRVAVVHPDQLALGRWMHRITPAGRVSTTIELRDGRAIVSDTIRSVFVGSATIVAPHFARSTPADRDYAAAELQALMVSWLESLGPRVVNRCDGTSISGPSWTPRRWLVEAQRAGLPLSSSVAATSARLATGWRGHPFAARLPIDTIASPAADARPDSAVVVGGRPVNARLRCDAECERLAASSGCRFFEIELVRQHDGPAVTGVRAPGRLRLDAPAAIRALADLLVQIGDTP